VAGAKAVLPPGDRNDLLLARDRYVRTAQRIHAVN
jgi:hypothetical protein